VKEPGKPEREGLKRLEVRWREKEQAEERRTNQSFGGKSFAE